MATAKEAFMKVESHEKECAIRYEHIEKRLEEGSHRPYYPPQQQQHS